MQYAGDELASVAIPSLALGLVYQEKYKVDELILPLNELDAVVSLLSVRYHEDLTIEPPKPRHPFKIDKSFGTLRGH